MRRPYGTVIAARATLSPAWHQTLAAWKISSARRSGINYSILALHLPSSCSTWHGTVPWRGLTTAYGDTSSRADGGSTGCDPRAPARSGIAPFVGHVSNRTRWHC